MLRYQIVYEICSDKVLMQEMSALLSFYFGNLTCVDLIQNFCVSPPHQRGTLVSSENDTFTLSFACFCVAFWSDYLNIK